MSPAPLRVACFGKLPFWPEYIDLGGTLPTSRAFKDWIRAGRAEAGLGDSSDGDTNPITREAVAFRANLRMLVGLPGSTELLAAVLRPSHGAGGREFPFAVFAHFPRRIYGRKHGLLPLALAPVWRELESAWHALASVASKAAFDEVVETLEVPHPGLPKTVRADLDLELRKTVGGMFDREDGASLEALRAGMPEVIEQLGRSQPGAAVRLPVSGDLSLACFQTSVWIELIHRQFFLRRFDPNILLDARRESPNRRVLLRFGRLRTSDYTAIGEGLEVDSPAIFDPAHRAGAEAGVNDDPPVSTYAELIREKIRSGRVSNSL